MGVKRDRDSAGMSNNNTETISEDEAALYDRQIRLWGLDCQKRLRDARILVIGVDGLGVEVVKNLTLCGVKAITLMDETLVSESDSSAQFFAVGQLGQGRASASLPHIRELNSRVEVDPAPAFAAVVCCGEPASLLTTVGRHCREKGVHFYCGRAAASLPHIRELNPRVQVDVDPAPASSLTPDALSAFSAVVCCGQPASLLTTVGRHCREKGVHFYCGATWGLYGYGFLDLIKHKFSRLNPKDADGKQETSFSTFEYCPLESALTAKVGAGISKRVSKVYPLLHTLSAFHEKHGRFPSPAHRANDIESLKELAVASLETLGLANDKLEEDSLSCVFGELSPVCAAVGGIMADQIIKGISCQGVPIHNFLLFDGDACVGATEQINVK